MPKFGPLGRDVYERTYSRRKPDGSSEDWDDTVSRVVAGNLELVDSRYHLPDEAERLTALMSDFRIIPGGGDYGYVIFSECGWYPPDGGG